MTVTLEALRDAGLLDALARHAEADWPRECCGLLVAEGGALRAVPCENVADAWHARDPQTFPRTARDGYLIDARVLIRHGDALRAVYHSHPNGSTALSDEDRRVAAPDGEPLWPGVAQVVVGVRDGSTIGAAVWRWDAGVWTEDTGQ